jgi:hypothetical protein
LEPLISRYLDAPTVEYGHLRWLLRRLAQFGAPGALELVVRRIGELSPALGDVTRYVMRAAENYDGPWPDAGEQLLAALERRVVRHSEYVSSVLLNLFSRVPALNHADRVTALFAQASPPVRREIVLAARAGATGAWLKERKAEFETADPWIRRALVAGASVLPGDEGIIWIKKLVPQLTLPEKLVARWTFRDRE